MRNIGKVPCGRDSLLYGIGGGLAVGAGRFIVKRKAMTASNWAVGAFAIISIGCWEWCNYQRLQHAKKVGVVVEKLNQLEEKRRQEGTAITTTTTTTTSDDDAN
ncbi:hypothetical protein BDF22DRAFT_193206 [Syncephalis plumigaleata]|nr:hypothetical protein BDF22DRAFT_193206 [Syncephalis plumigaleata]